MVKAEGFFKPFLIASSFSILYIYIYMLLFYIYYQTICVYIVIYSIRLYMVLYILCIYLYTYSIRLIFVISEAFELRRHWGCEVLLEDLLCSGWGEGRWEGYQYMIRTHHWNTHSDYTHQDRKADEKGKKRVLKWFNLEKHFPFRGTTLFRLGCSLKDTLSRRFLFFLSDFS